MGAGKKFRVSYMQGFVAFGFSIVPNGEHALSIHIELIKIGIYLGFGKGYDERSY